MSTLVQIDKNKCNFVTEEAIINFAKIFPGQAVEIAAKAGSRYYKCEVYFTTVSKSMIDAFSYVAQIYAPANWQDHVNAQFRTLEQICTPIPGQPLPKRSYDKYPYAKGKYVMNFTKAVSLKMLYKDQVPNLADPVVRADYDRKINAAAPKVSRYPNLADPADVARLDQMNQELLLRGQPGIPRNEYAQTMLPVGSTEIWNGCRVRIAGRVYWDEQTHKTCLPALEQIMLVGPGERLSGLYEAAPEDVFGSFAPAADLAPDPFAHLR